MARARFADRVYAACRRIPKGKVTTYGAIARALHQPGAARAVGNALNANPHAPRVPCHRVVQSDGKLGGFARGTKRKEAMLKAEGVKIRNGRVDARLVLAKI